MTVLSSLALLAGLYLLILASPGPNFFILTQLSLEGRRAEANGVVAGLATASVVWAIVALTGASALLAQGAWLSTAVRLLGAAYLVWYGGRLLRSALAKAPPPAAAPARTAGMSPRHAYRTGLLTGLTNPKGAAWYTSVFAAVFPAHAPGWTYPATVVMIGAISLAWHLGVTRLFASRPLRAGYLRVERGIKGVAGAALIGVGLQRAALR
jgi:threonine efflux protein